MKERGSGSGRKIGNNLVALSSAAILTVYAAGYLRTRSAADRFAAPPTLRRPIGENLRPSPSTAALSPAPVSSAPPAPAALSPQPSTLVAQGAQPSSAPRPAARTSAEPVAQPPVQTPAQPSLQTAAQTPEQTNAQTTAAAVSLPAAPPLSPPGPPESGAPEAQAPASEVHYKDGTFSGWGYCRHGDIQATVIVEKGKLIAAGVTQCLTRYSCSWIEKLPPQVVDRQSADVDYVSGATESSDAFADAVVDALSKAR
ncbi:MAG TPA: FMN-binding protein [Vicinamibacterales bacterium]|nr:FMN-binding protein [Vicinamibacterales bacterium]